MHSTVASVASGTVLAMGIGSFSLDSAKAHPPVAVIADRVRSPMTARQSRREILVVDERVAGHRALAAAALRGVEVFVLRRDRDGVAQVGEILSTRRDVSALHVIAHGRPGTLFLGASELSQRTIGDYRMELSRWFDPAQGRPDLLLYGCNVAAGNEGRVFLSQLAAGTGADVAASTNRTGGDAIGADWQLEAHVGPIETTLPIRTAVARAYPEALDVFVVSSLDNAGPGSLRDAIAKANADADHDTIVFSATCGTDGGTCLTGDGGAVSSDGTLTGTIHLERFLDITQSVSIVGPGRDLLVLDGGYEPGARIGVPILSVWGGGSAIDVSIAGLALANGGGSYYGGAVQTYGTNLELSDCRISGSRADTSYGGGAVAVHSTATLAVHDCEFIGNRSSRGGAIAAYGPVTLTRALFRDNVAAYGGGALFVEGGVKVEATDCSLVGNESAAYGGAALVFGELLLGNSTLSGNRSEDYGSAIKTFYGGRIELVHTTVFSAPLSMPDAGTTFGSTAISLEEAPPTRSVVSDSILWGAGTDLELSGDAAPEVHRIIVGSVSGTLASDETVSIGVDPMLMPLADNGGPTPTHAIASSSPAVDRATNPKSYPFDQRGVGYSRVDGSAADLGAFEYHAPVATDAGVIDTDAGATDVDGGAVEDAGSTDASSPPDATEDGCGCATAGAESGPSASRIAAVFAALMSLLRRRRRK